MFIPSCYDLHVICGTGKSHPLAFSRRTDIATLQAATSKNQSPKLQQKKGGCNNAAQLINKQKSFCKYFLMDLSKLKNSLPLDGGGFVCGW
jgi:hypothetical protein